MLNEESHNLDEEGNILKPNDDALLVTQIVSTAPCSHHPVSEITCFKCGKRGHYQFNCTNTIPVFHKMKLQMLSLIRKMIAFNCKGIFVSLVYCLQRCIGISNTILKIVTSYCFM